MPARLLPDLDRPTYDNLAGMRKSVLWYGDRSMAHLKWAIDHPDGEASDAMNLGSATHTLTMEPHKLEAEYITAPKCDRRTKEGKAVYAAFCEQAEGKIVLSEDQLTSAYIMATALRSVDLVSDLLATPGGMVEPAIQWTDEPTGVLCKCRLDFLVDSTDPPVILDIKTTRDARRKAFRSSMYEFGYHVQAAMYCDAVQALTGKAPVFIFACVENVPPHNAKTYYLSDRSLWLGQHRYRELLEQYRACCESGDWPGYDEDPEELDLPSWAEV